MEAADMLELIDLTKRYDIKSIPAVLDLNLKIGGAKFLDSSARTAQEKRPQLK